MKHLKPPAPADWLLGMFCSPARLEEVQGDLEERFQRRAVRSGRRRAQLAYFLEVLGFARFLFKKRPKETRYTKQTFSVDMLHNYLRISWRNLLKAKGYAFINIAGLMVGMTASAMIFFWIRSELRFDRQYSQADRIYQVYNRDVFSGEKTVWPTTPSPLAPELKTSFPDIELAARYAPLTLLLSVNEVNSNVKGALTDPDFLRVFDVRLLSGSERGALTGAGGIIISKRLAVNLFGTENAVGKTVQIDHRDNFLVSAVMDNMSENTQFQDLDYLVPWEYMFRPDASGDWTANNHTTFVMLREGATEAAVNRKIRKVTAGHLKGAIDNVSNREIFLHPARKWHLYSKIEKGELVDGGIIAVRLFGVIAVFILAIACVNFVNLSTARGAMRAKEVGIRKVAGAPKGSLVLRFISEAVLLAGIAGLWAVAVIWAVTPLFNDLVGKQIDPNFGSPLFWASGLAFVLVTGLLAGSYPAFFLSAFQPARVLKGTYKRGPAVVPARQGLVVLQFAFAIVLIISTLVIRNQIDHAEKRDSGYNRENLLYTALPGNLEKHYALLRDELIGSGAVVSATRSLGPTMSLNTRQWGVQFPGSVETDKDVEFDLFGADRHFVRTSGVTLLEGREIDISKYASDSTAIVLNETAVKAMRLKNPVGTVVRFQKTDWHVTGVVRDFIYESPYSPVKPAIITGPGGMLPHQWVNLRLNPAQPLDQNLRTVESIFKTIDPGYPFTYSFADDTYAARFAREKLIGTLTSIFTGLAIFISCLGIFGLAAFSAQQRMKEIGVRKVLGASVPGIVGMLTGDFVKLVGISFVIAAPIGWYAMEKWLADFDYRVQIGPGVFLFTICSKLLIVTATVIMQAIRAALMNPVRSLASE
ncbi:ABC transporter permease [Dyadobacter beijingensis]|uniref:ABC transporter permease n=1 Tax=Dyadobacter beijingensis TaxID=365489 RepID=A0ABQ2I3C7_9BACT|nr:ABC transporter permease [Dyadobacter beijingensis]GGM96918.1 ABC transporter permease [Dyadobacter beijingensis]